MTSPFDPATVDPPSLRLTVHDPGPAGVARVALAGELDEAGVGAFRDAVARALLGRPRVLRLEAGDLAFIGSAGIRALLHARSAAAQLGCEFVLGDPHPCVRRVLEIADLLDVFGLAEPGAGHVAVPRRGPLPATVPAQTMRESQTRRADAVNAMREYSAARARRPNLLISQPSVGGVRR